MSDITLLHGDCLDLMRDIPDGSVDAIIADLPYGTTDCKWDTVIPFEPLWAHYKRIIKRNGAIVLFGSQPFTSALVMSNPRMFRYSWAWDKALCTGFLNAKKQPLRAHEDIAVFSYVGSITYNPQKTQRSSAELARISKRQYITDDSVSVYGPKPLIRPWRDTMQEKYPTSVLRINALMPSDFRHRVHPTQKPVALLEYLIRTYTNEGEMVLDNTMGSGTTGVACVNTGRHFIGIEKDAGYFQIAEKRIQEAQGKARQMTMLEEVA